MLWRIPAYSRYVSSLIDYTTENRYRTPKYWFVFRCFSFLRFCVSFQGCRNPQHSFFKWFSLIANLANSEFLSRTLRHPVFRSSVKCKAVTKAGQSFVEIMLKLTFQVLSNPKLSRHMRQWFKLERAYEMMEAYEEEHEDFDLVLKLRNGCPTMGKTALQSWL